MKAHVLYLDDSMIIFHNLNSAIYVPGILKTYFVERTKLIFISEKLITVTYVDDGECSHESDVEEEFVYLQNTIIWRTQLTFYQDA